MTSVSMNGFAFIYQIADKLLKLALIYLVNEISLAANPKDLSFFALQGFYRVKSVSLFRFTMLFQGQMSLPFLIYKAITEWNWSLFFDVHGYQSPFFDFQCFYRVKSVSLFRFSVFLHDIYQVVVNYLVWFTCYLQNVLTIFTVYLHDLVF